MMARAFFWLACLLYVGQQSFAVAVAQAVAEEKQTLSSEEEFGIDLFALSDKELEEICTVRGFELVQEVDDATGEEYVFSHDDYVEAARQCLSIERDMEEIIAEHPEIREELEAERERMMSEKERLEAELEKAQAKEKGGTETNAAFVSGVKSASESTKEEEKTSAPQESKTEDSTGAEKEPLEIADGSQVDDSKTGIQSDSAEGSPLSIQAMVKDTVLEVQRKVKHDVSKLVDLVLPESIREPLVLALRPIIAVGKDLAKGLFEFLDRHVRALVKEVKRRIEERKNASEEAPEKVDDDTDNDAN